MQREEAAFVAAAAGQGFVAGTRGELAENETVALVAGDAVQSGLLLEIRRGVDVERERDGLAVEELRQTADRACGLDLVPVQRGAPIECEGRVGSGHRGFKGERLDAFAGRAARARQDQRAVLDEKLVEAERLERGRWRSTVCLRLGRVLGALGSRLGLRHGDDGIDQRDLGHLDLAADQRR